MIKSASNLTRLLMPFSLPRFHLSYRPNQTGQRTLDLYKKIRQKQTRNLRQSIVQSHPQTIQKNYKTHRCDGCNSLLQHQSKSNYGYIDKQVMLRSLQNNADLIQQSYGVRAHNKDSRTLEMIAQVEREMGVDIMGENGGRLRNLDRVQVLVRLQEKIDQYQEGEQTIRRISKQRKDILCYRCYSLKFHNKLPQQFDVPTQQPQNNQQQLMNKIFTKHKSSQALYLYIIDVLDLAGTLQKYVLDRLLDQRVTFAIVVNKVDIINRRYLNRNKIMDVVRQTMMELMRDGRDQQDVKEMENKIGGLRIFMTSSVSKDGVRRIQQFIQKSGMKRIQLVGFPNTGKTTLLNQLSRMNKPTSKVPGTTLYINQSRYNKTSVIYDMPGMYSSSNMYNLISRPNLRGMLAWNKYYSPPIMLNKTYFYGGRVQIDNCKIILFGMGGACSSDNRWFILNYRQFWKGLPELNQLQIIKYQIEISFKQGRGEDIQIAGWGFMGFRLVDAGRGSRVVRLWLPRCVAWRVRATVLGEDQVLGYRSVVKKRHGLAGIYRNSMAEGN